MLVIYRILKYFFAFIIAAWLMLIFFKSDYIIGNTVFLLLFISAGSYLLINKKLNNWKKSLYYSLFPLLIIISGFFYLLLVEVWFLKIIIILFISFLCLLYLNEIYKESFLSPLVPIDRQRQLFLLLSAIIIFFTASALFGLSDFLNIFIINLIIPFGLVIFLLTNYLIYQEDKIGISRMAINVIMAFLLMELFWAISILPIVYYIKGLIVSFFFLLMIQFLVISRASESLKAVIRNYLIIILGLLLGLLSTSRWF